MKVIDNFLDKESFEKIKNGIVNNSYFPLYFSEYKDYLKEISYNIKEWFSNKKKFKI